GRVRAPQLVKLIHEVNPTGLEMEPAAERRRYALKSRLQSLLIRTFSDDVAVLPVPEQEDVVALHYRPHHRDACHAVVSELDDDARSLVRLKLDLAGAIQISDPHPGEEPAGRVSRAPDPAAGAPEDPRELLRLGREALEVYDFERGQAYLEEAFSRSSGGAPEALALLAFLIDHMAAYPAAVELKDRLSQAALRDEGVRALLAFAAANVGETTTCRRFIAGTEGHHAAAAWALLGRDALARSDLAQAESCLKTAERLEPGLPELVALGADLVRLKAQLRQPEEEELATLLASEDEEAAARKAEAILNRWPESGSARKAQRDLCARRRAREAQALCRRAEAACAAGQLEAAVAGWRQAAHLGATGLEERIARACSQEEALRRERRIEAVQSALGRTPEPTQLLAYLALEPSERQVVRDRTKLPELDWLEQLRRGSPEKEREPDAHAVAALSRAAKLRPPEATDEVLALLSHHAQRLRRLEVARRLLDEAQRAREEAKAKVAQEHLRAARHALLDGNLDEAIRLASDPKTLTLRAEAATVLDDARARQQRRRRLERYQEALARDDLFEALEIVRETGGSANDQGWEERRAEVARRLREKLAVEAAACPDGVDAPEYSERPLEDSHRALDLDGDHLFLTRTFDRELFLLRFSLSRQKADLFVSMKTPEPIAFPRLVVEGPTLWVIGAKGAALQLSTTSWNVLQWHQAPAFIPDSEVVDEVTLVPGTEFLWILTHRRANGLGEVVRIFKLGQARPIREIRGGWIAPVASPDGTSLVLVHHGEGRLCAPAGNVVRNVPEGVEHVATLAEGHIASLVEEDGDEIELTGFDQQGKVIASTTIRDVVPDSAHLLASSSSAAAAFVLYESDEPSCAAFSLHNQSLRRLWTCSVPANAILAQDVRGMHVALAWPTAKGLRAQVIDRRAPVCPPPDEFPRRSVPWMESQLCCGYPPREDLESVTFELAREAREEPSDIARERLVRSAIDKLREDPVGLLDLATELRSFLLPNDARTVQAFARERFPEHSGVLLDEANQLAGEACWTRVNETLSLLDPGQLDPWGLAHVHHLRGLALYGEGRYEEAAVEMDEAAHVPRSTCALHGWGPWLRFLAYPTERPSEDPAVRFLASIVHADLLLACGDCIQAAAELGDCGAWNALDIQLRARLAHALLLQPDRDPVHRVRKRFAVAAFLHEYGRQPAWPRMLPLGSWSLSQEELASLASRARAWLNGVH
ncbi:MAG TPA: hypothetical protein VMK12_30630, partial [Anaeromyxobacteraceae bacterium]|nr:hypothetical protein [Anaeromyxobacteraceae bacterium]